MQQQDIKGSMEAQEEELRNRNTKISMRRIAKNAEECLEKLNITLDSTIFYVIIVEQSMDQEIDLHSGNHTACLAGLDILVKYVVLCGILTKFQDNYKTFLC